MYELKQTETFSNWWNRLRDKHAQGIIVARLDRLAYGHTGDAAPAGDGVSELRIHHGPGYRIYFQKRENAMIILLCGGNKNTQAKDIKTAKRLAKLWEK